MHFSIFEVILFVFLTALIVSVIFRRLNLSVILGYLAVGALVGPNAIGLVPDSDYITKLAEFGIVFLMFTVGLEFSLSKLFALRTAVFFVGGLQVLICVGLTALLGVLFGLNLVQALITGGIIAMSSTALIIKQLNDQFELQSQHGLNSLGILLFQDLAVIPLVILITSIATDTEQTNLGLILLWALLKGAFAIFVIFILGRWILQPFFRFIAKSHAIELFTMTVLLLTLTVAWITESLGLSYSLGAFLGGVMLAETTYRHQIEVEIRPFRDILLGLFFITIGMMVNMHSWYQTWPEILLLVLGLVIGKMIIVIALSRLAGAYASTAAKTGIILAQGGEFGFAILGIAMAHNLLSNEYQQILLAALLISLAIGPILIRFNQPLSKLLTQQSKDVDNSETQHEIIAHAQQLKNHVIICGYGRVGQHVARILDKVNAPYIGIDFDADLVQHASLAGDQIIYGDSSNPEILEKAGIEHAKALLVTLTDHRATIKILSLVRTLYPDLPILVRCRDRTELNQLKKTGATHIIAELFEASLTLSNHLLQILLIPRPKIVEIIQGVRNTDYDLLHKVFIGALPEDNEEIESSLHEQLSPIVITEEAYAANKKIADLGLKEIGVDIVAIRRGSSKQVEPKEDVIILPHDIVVIFGTIGNLEIAEQRLLEGI